MLEKLYDLLEKLYDLLENSETEECKSVSDFLTEHVKRDDEIGDMFLTVVRNTRRAGFKSGVRAVICY